MMYNILYMSFCKIDKNKFRLCILKNKIVKLLKVLLTVEMPAKRCLESRWMLNKLATWD